VDIHRLDVPERFDQTGAISCISKKVYRIQIRFQGSRSAGASGCSQAGPDGGERATGVAVRDVSFQSGRLTSPHMPRSGDAVGPVVEGFAS
jgi:hypothetical protein